MMPSCQVGLFLCLPHEFLFCEKCIALAQFCSQKQILSHCFHFGAMEVAMAWEWPSSQAMDMEVMEEAVSKSHFHFQIFMMIHKFVFEMHHTFLCRPEESLVLKS